MRLSETQIFSSHPFFSHPTWVIAFFCGVGGPVFLRPGKKSLTFFDEHVGRRRERLRGAAV